MSACPRLCVILSGTSYKIPLVSVRGLGVRKKRSRRSSHATESRAAKKCPAIWVLSLSLSLSLISICFLELFVTSSLAQNIVSRPVGFIRLNANASALASSPFTALDSGETAILTWDAESQQYALTNMLPVPGQGFALAETQTVFLAGELALEETNQATLYPGLNLVGYPYAGSVPREETALKDEVLADSSNTNTPENLKLGEAYWLNVTGEACRVWVETRPYANVFPEDEEPPVIEGLQVQGGTSVVLSIRGAGEEGERLDVYYQDVGPESRFSSTGGWSLAAGDLQTAGDGVLQWTDADPELEGVFGRYYLVGRGDLDLDGDGVPDAREQFIAGTLAAMDGALTGEMAALDAEGSFLTDVQSDALIIGTNGESNVTASVQLARVIYVDQTRGNDSYTGKKPTRSMGDGPKKTISSGAEAVGDEGVLVLREGNYAEALDVRGKDVQVYVDGRVLMMGGRTAVEGTSAPESTEILGSTTNR